MGVKRAAKRVAKRSKAPGRRRPQAVTADILGPSRRNGPVPAKWKTFFRHLDQTRRYLLAQQNGRVRAAVEETPAFSLHMADAATDSFDRDFALSLASSEQEALYEVEEAIQRIHNDTYGICELTGKPIERKRLEAIPWTRFSLAAEKTLEKEGAVYRARLGPRRAVQAASRAEENAAAEEAAEE